MKKFILPLSHIKKADLPMVGGKALPLAKLFRAGIIVPDGFVVTVQAFHYWKVKTEIGRAIQTLISALDTKNLAMVNSISDKITTLINDSEMPRGIIAEVMNAFQKLGAKQVAVRSSAPFEDQENQSWAGEFESFTGVTEKNVVEKIKHCWASLFTPRALIYGCQKYQKNPEMAVLVQKMVSSEVSGVCFTKDPLGQEKNTMLIEAVYGLGELLVGGNVTPDRYWVIKDLEVISDIIPQFQAYKYALKPNGNTGRVPVVKQLQHQQKLSGKLIIQISAISKVIERKMRFPQDIEWALENNIFYILQSRPITTLSSNDKKKVR